MILLFSHITRMKKIVLTSLLFALPLSVFAEHHYQI